MMQANKIYMQNAHDASTFPHLFYLPDQLYSQERLSHIRTLAIECELSRNESIMSLRTYW
jgi:hypothetical protein